MTKKYTDEEIQQYESMYKRNIVHNILQAVRCKLFGSYLDNEGRDNLFSNDMRDTYETHYKDMAMREGEGLIRFRSSRIDPGVDD